LRNILFVSLLIISTLASCSPSKTLPPTVTDSGSSTANTLLTSTPEPSATIESPQNETPSLTPTPRAFNSLTSPNGEFIASAYDESQLPSGIPTIEIRDKDGKLVWRIPFQGEMPTSDPHDILDIFQWAKDSSQLYFYYVFYPDGGDRAFWWTGSDLQKIDLTTGEIQPVLPGKDFMSFAISPDGTQIAYTRQQDKPSIFYVRDLVTGSEKTAYVLFGSRNYARVGAILWSPSGKEIAFQTETDENVVQTIVLNLSTMKQKVILKYNLVDSWIFVDAWASDEKLQFSQLPSSIAQPVTVFQIDVETLETLELGTATPTP
jgi:hypothetical protein